MSHFQRQIKPLYRQEPGHVGRRSAERDVLDASPAAFETLALDAIAPSALEVR